MLNHLAIIMDGNGRWAKAKNLPRAAGHKKGADSARDVIKFCVALGINHLTLYTFSMENWNRPDDEVNDLMNLLRFYLGKELHGLHKNNVRIRIIGDRTKLSEDIQSQIQQAEELTAKNTTLSLNVAISYGSRQEIVNAVKTIAEGVAKGSISLDEINDVSFEKYLYTSDIPDPDLLIRTGGEERLSNFLLWQSAYTEFYFTETLWPAFNKSELEQAVDEFNKRERRYGTTAISKVS